MDVSSAVLSNNQIDSLLEYDDEKGKTSERKSDRQIHISRLDLKIIIIDSFFFFSPFIHFFY